MADANTHCEICDDLLDNQCHSCAEYMRLGQPNRTGVIGPNHALLVGQIIGLLLKSESITLLSPGTSKAPELILDDKGNYQNYFFITRPSGKYRVTITPEDVQEP